MVKEIDWVEIAKVEPIVCIGQISKEQRRALDRLARRGEILKWRGYWNTFSPHFGIGPLKTCFGPADTNTYTVGCVDLDKLFQRLGIQSEAA